MQDTDHNITIDTHEFVYIAVLYKSIYPVFLKLLFLTLSCIIFFKIDSWYRFLTSAIKFRYTYHI